MKRVSEPATSRLVASVPRRLGVAEAKARLSEVLRGLQESPVVIHSRGRDVGVLLDIDTFNRVHTADQPRAGGPAFLARLAALRERLGNGVEGFAPARAELIAAEPFQVRRR